MYRGSSDGGDWSAPTVAPWVRASSGRTVGLCPKHGASSRRSGWDRQPVAPRPRSIAVSVAAKLAWLADNESERLEAARWVLTPRDLIGGVVDRRRGHRPHHGVAEWPLRRRRRVGRDPGRNLGRTAATCVPSDRVTGTLTPASADALGLVPDTPVVIGAGDRAPARSSARAPLNPAPWSAGAPRPTSPPGGHTSRAGARGGRAVPRRRQRLAAGGRSVGRRVAAGLDRCPDRSSARRVVRVGRREPARRTRGITATPWLEGARAPWWRRMPPSA